MSENKIFVFITAFDMCSLWMLLINLKFFKYYVKYFMLITEFVANLVILAQRRVPHPHPSPVLHTEGMRSLLEKPCPSSVTSWAGIWE